MHVEDRWTRPSGKLDQRGKPERIRTERYGQGLRYLATWTEGGGKRRSKSFTTKDGANSYIAAVAKAQRDGVHIDSHKMTVAQFGDQWVTTQVHQRESTRAQMMSRWANHIRPTLGELLLREVTRQHVQAAVLKWSASDLAPATVGVIYGYVAGLFKAAVLDRLVASSPCVNVNLPRTDHERVVPLTVAQVKTIAERITPRYRGLVLLGAASGMRSGEIRGLTSDRLRWENRPTDGTVTVRIDRQLVTTAPTWGPPKTSRSDRTITLDPTSAGELLAHIAAYQPHPSGLIFTGREGGPLARTSIATAWKTATTGMGLPTRYGLHALRHFHASLLIAAGMSVTAVADRLGHQDATETLQTYAHLWPTDEGRSRDAIAVGLWG